ncbi:NADPH-dependent 1-acyl dihydroxyacetone phosphate reductase [Maublancomyces gigas]|uniref:NADPH-dependent 1-acyl dihydroxyacetone phosphate reductase n=1 Tax=Discina gigas TaxID=1032678 RepID=A0ABR3GBE5_9PEZI
MASTTMTARKSVLITGAGIGGIGGELAKEFHAKGFRVFATARRLETVQELQDTLGIEIIQLDVTKAEDVRKARDEISLRTGGKLDVLVNNAFGLLGPDRDYSIELEIDTVVKEIFEINLFAVMRMVQEFAHLLIAAEGTIVNIGSVAGIMPFAFASAYNASKAALHSYADTLRVELKPFNVKVMTIITGGVKSGISRHSVANRDLRPDSLYLPILEFYQARASTSQVNAQPTDEYARSVVKQVMMPDWRKPVWYWQGNFSGWVWLINTFLWKSAFDYGMMRTFGLLGLGRKWAAEKMEKAKKTD